MAWEGKNFIDDTSIQQKEKRSTGEHFLIQTVNELLGKEEPILERRKGSSNTNIPNKLGKSPPASVDSEICYCHWSFESSDIIREKRNRREEFDSQIKTRSIYNGNTKKRGIQDDDSKIGWRRIHDVRNATRRERTRIHQSLQHQESTRKEFSVHLLRTTQLREKHDRRTLYGSRGIQDIVVFVTTSPGIACSCIQRDKEDIVKERTLKLDSETQDSLASSELLYTHSNVSKKSHSSCHSFCLSKGSFVWIKEVADSIEWWSLISDSKVFIKERRFSTRMLD